MEFSRIGSARNRFSNSAEITALAQSLTYVAPRNHPGAAGTSTSSRTGSTASSSSHHQLGRVHSSAHRRTESGNQNGEDTVGLNDIPK